MRPVDFSSCLDFQRTIVIDFPLRTRTWNADREGHEEITFFSRMQTLVRHVEDFSLGKVGESESVGSLVF